ncbi:MAG: hypothetical protein UZ07_CHB004002541 [Chlorobi bacterium OLB7]|nr:MAG: hypothetical protein UZ07_CHB004002541 [Chlorobi bacterium OLB7]
MLIVPNPAVANAPHVSENGMVNCSRSRYREMPMELSSVIATLLPGYVAAPAGPKKLEAYRART